MANERWWPEFEAVVKAVSSTPGTSHAALRQWAAARGAGGEHAEPPPGTPAAVPAYVDLVAAQAYRTTDAHIDGLRAAGVVDDEIFEVTAAAAVGAGRRRLERALSALEEAGE